MIAPLSVGCMLSINLPLPASFCVFRDLSRLLIWTLTSIRRFSGLAVISILTMSRKLPNYLRMYRKRSGLSQEETALLLGYPNGQQVSRCERFTRQPSLQTILAYEAVFGETW